MKMKTIVFLSAVVTSLSLAYHQSNDNSIANHHRKTFLGYKNENPTAIGYKYDVQKRSSGLGGLFLNKRKKKKLQKKVQIANVHELQEAVLDHGIPLCDIETIAEFSNYTTSTALNHDVVQLIAQRFFDKTTPQNRTDKATLAVAIEGGGMKGAIAAGMSACLATLGLLDTIDIIYGSSAGSVVGAYMVSRQVAVDVLTEVLPNAKQDFLCKRRLVKSLISNFAEQKSRLPFQLYKKPGMNLSFVLDSVMPEVGGLRPLDMESFHYSDKHHQKLRVVASCVDRENDDALIVKCFGTEDFTEDTISSTGRTGLLAVMEASMNVPGVTGIPLDITRKSNTSSSSSSLNLKSFDAFCFEPLPYRSAVEEGATHVLVLRNQLQDFTPPTQRTFYEYIAPNYFRRHNEKAVADYFWKGGQQYLYLEDHLTLEEGLRTNQKVRIPPSGLNYGVKNPCNKDRKTWKQAHVLPIALPPGTPELSNLEQDSNPIIEAVQSGYAAAFDLLAPAIGISGDFDGKQIAELIFPLHEDDDNEEVQQPLQQNTNLRKRERFKNLLRKKRKEETTTTLEEHNEEETMLHWGNDGKINNCDAATLELLRKIPAIGQFPSLYSCISKLNI